MNRKDIIPGKKYALREASNQPDFQCVRVEEYIRREKWLAEWIEPNQGLVDIVKSRDLLCLWDERNRYAGDERNAKELREETKRDWPGEDHPLDTAVHEVLGATGEQVEISEGTLSGPPDSLNRIAERAGFKWPYSTIPYTDRFSIRHYPWSIALGLAKSFATAEPNTILLHIEIDERKWEIKAREVGGSHILPMLEHYRAAWAIIREWAGFDADRARLEVEIERLWQLIDKVIWMLRTGNPHSEHVANWLSRSVKGE